MKVTLNADMGESFGAYTMGDDANLIKYVDLANIACGFHAGDYTVMDETVRLAKENNVKVGAHPSLPDLQGFGRRELKLESEELKNCLIYQIGALKAFLKKHDMPLNHIKPHGKLYGMTADNKSLAEIVCEVALLFNVPILGMKHTHQETASKEMGVEFIEEFFSDLEYNNKGGLIITRKHKEPDMLEVEKKIKLALLEKKVYSNENALVDTGCDSICVHSDTLQAIEIAKSVRKIVDAYNKGTPL